MRPLPRKATGTIESHPWKDGRTVTWRLRVRAHGRRHRIDLGTNHEGWSEERAQVELERIMGMVERGTWQPPSAVAAAPEPTDLADETMQVTASRWWQRKRQELRPNTEADYRWRLDFILAFFADDLTSSIEIARVDEFREVLVKQRTQHGRPLAPRSVNMILDVLAQILDLAVEYKMLDQNPARGKRRRMRVEKGSKAFLEADMVVDLLDVAGEWEAELPGHQRYGRRHLLAVLCLAGPRISEATQARRSDLDIHGGRLRVGDAKTDAGERDIETTAFLMDELRAHLASSPMKPSTPIFHSRNGKALNPSNVRGRLIAECVKRANERRAAAGKILIPERITPHALRRTFASLALTAGRDPRWVMAQLGHADARLTLNVYAQVMQRKRVDRDLIWSLMRFSDEPEAPPRPGRFGPTIDPSGEESASGESASMRAA